jgi:hypothetical protein
MAQIAYQGQVSYSAAAARAVGDSDSVIAPADRSNYNPLDSKWANQPGAGARANGYPRADGQPGRAN